MVTRLGCLTLEIFILLLSADFHAFMRDLETSKCIENAEVYKISKVLSI